MRGMRSIVLLASVLMLMVNVMTAFAAPSMQPASGQICVLAFDDQNGNGKREPDEPLLPNVDFRLWDTAGGEPRTYRTDGNSEPYCFGNLPTGQFNVQARASGSFDPTTSGQWLVPLSGSAQFDIAYGLRRIANQPASTSGTSPLGRIALGSIGLIVLAGAGYVFFTVVQRVRSR